MNNQQNGRVILWLTWQKYETMYQLLTCKEEKILKDSLDLIPSPSPSVKIQIIGGKVYLR